MKCCACDGALDDGPINVVNLPKIATWEKPVSGNIFMPGQLHFAIAIVCAQCIMDKTLPKVAVEWKGFDAEDEDIKKVVTYHPLDELDDYILGS